MTCVVTNLADSGPGSFRDAVQQSRPDDVGLEIIFDVGGDILLQDDIIIERPYVTIAGQTAPAPGITVRKQSEFNGEFQIWGTHDVVVRNLRFHGLYSCGSEYVGCNNTATIKILGNIYAPPRPFAPAKRIVLDHITSRNATDGGPDIYGDIEDLTVSWCLFFNSWHPTLIAPAGKSRRRISMHHNVYAKNGERCPHIEGETRDLDFVNNVIYDWGRCGDGWDIDQKLGLHGYGMAIATDTEAIDANIVSNYFLLSGAPPHIRGRAAFGYWNVSGGDGLKQGTVYPEPLLGHLWVNGNVFPAEAVERFSTKGAPLPIPAKARVTTIPASELDTRMLPFVGALPRTLEEQLLIEEIAANMR